MRENRKQTVQASVRKPSIGNRQATVQEQTVPSQPSENRSASRSYGYRGGLYVKVKL